MKFLIALLFLHLFLTTVFAASISKIFIFVFQFKGVTSVVLLLLLLLDCDLVRQLNSLKNLTKSWVIRKIIVYNN